MQRVGVPLDAGADLAHAAVQILSVTVPMQAVIGMTFGVQAGLSAPVPTSHASLSLSMQVLAS